MEKEPSDGFSSLLLLLLALFLTICCLELGSTEDKTAAGPKSQGDLISMPDLQASATPPSTRTATKQRLIL